MFSSDKIIFNNKMHEMSDVGTNQLSEITQHDFKISCLNIARV